MTNFLISSLPVKTCIVIAILFQAVLAAPPQSYQFLNLTEALEKSSKTQKPIFLYFGRYGCSTCRKMHQEVFSDEVVLKSYNENFVLAYVDTESSNRIQLPTGERTTEMQFSSRNRILGTPTFIYFSAEQKPLFQKAGFQSIEQMTRYGEYVISAEYKSQTLAEFLSK